MGALLLLAVLSAAFLGSVPGAARADESVLTDDAAMWVDLRAEAGEGGARLAFAWPVPADAVAAVEGGRLVVRFERPFAVSLAAAVRALPDYLTDGMHASDRRSVSFGLARPVAVKTGREGALAVVSLIDGEPRESVAAPLPPPQRLVPAERPAPPESPIGTSLDIASVPIRVGEHAGFSRIVFDWRAMTTYDVVTGGREAEIRFDRRARFDLSGLSLIDRALLKLDGEVADRAVVRLPEGGQVRHFRSGTRVVIDLMAPATSAAGKAPSPRPASVPAASGPSPASAQAAPRPPRAAVVQKPATAPSPRTPAAPPAKPVDDAAAVAWAPTAGPALAVEVARSRSEASLRFPWGEGVRAAAFKRAGHVWLIFDRPARVDLAAVRKLTADLVPAIEQRPNDTVTVIRMAVLPGFSPGMRREGGVWLLELKPQAVHPDRPVSGVSEPLAASGARVVISVEQAGAVVPIEDPEVGDSLLVVPLMPLGVGVPRDQDFPEFRLLASAQGIAVAPRVEGLRVQATPRQVELSTVGGLKLSGGPLDAPRRARRQGGDEETGRLFDFVGWQRVGQPYNATQQQLRQAVASAGRDGVDIARQELARFLFARGMGPEAAAQLDLVAESDPGAMERPRFRALRGAARYLFGNLEAASADLMDAALDGDTEAALWRGAVFAEQGRWGEAGYAFRRGRRVLETYPDWLRQRFGLLAAEAEIESGQGKQAQEYLGLVTEAAPTGPNRNRFDYLRGRLLAGQASPDEAIALWQDVAAGTDLRSAARARLAIVETRLRTGRMDHAAAIEELERLRYTWRGDAVEFEVLRQLGRTYLDADDYWNGLSTLRGAVALFADGMDTGSLTEMMAAEFRNLYVDGEARRIPPLKALSLYEEFRELTPIGEDGDRILRDLASRLVGLDLLNPAAELLDHQIRFRLNGARRARIAADLALIQLLNRNPQAALDALDASRAEDLPADVTAQRRHLRARALAELGRPDDALRLLADDDGAEAATLRADMFWRSQRWSDAARMLAGLAPPAGDAPLEAGQSRTILRWGVAAALAGDAATLADVARRYGSRMAETPDAAAFDMIVTGQGRPGQSLDEVTRTLAEVDEFQGYLKTYRDQLEKPATSAPAGAGAGTS